MVAFLTVSHDCCRAHLEDWQCHFLSTMKSCIADQRCLRHSSDLASQWFCLPCGRCRSQLLLTSPSLRQNCLVHEEASEAQKSYPVPQVLGVCKLKALKGLGSNIEEAMWAHAFPYQYLVLQSESFSFSLPASEGCASARLGSKKGHFFWAGNTSRTVCSLPLGN